mmetsp:Transcript_47757/g.120380  ORF Transcript_47757/g.120380 Transcript_47757/m.120380 type:complete len:691 (-) Transcript_47757:422-2494(-)
MAGEVVATAFIPAPAASSLAGSAMASPPVLETSAWQAPAVQTSSMARSSMAIAATVGAGVSVAVGAGARRRRQAKRGKAGKNGRVLVAAVDTDIEAQAAEGKVQNEEVEIPALAAEDDLVSLWDVVQRNGMAGVPDSFDGIRHEEETAQDRVFSWLGKGPKPESECFQSLQKFFPGALPGSAVHLRSRAVLEKEFGFTPANTLLGTSFCPDEINNQDRDIGTKMRKYWGKVFPMGGISGTPYVGETGFVAFSSHVPDDGNIIVVFGPHVGISEEGEVGQYLREGQTGNSTACGAVIGAYNACLSGFDGAPSEDGEYDMQMDEIKQEFVPHAEAISKSENPMAAAAYVAYEMVKDRTLKIVNTKFGSGKLVLIGGIQLNMPFPDYADHFLPLMFEVRQEGQPTQDLMKHFVNPSIQQDLTRAPWAAVTAQREVFAWLTWSPPALSPVYRTMHTYFPGALPGQAVHERLVKVLERFGFDTDNTILGTSVCPDEINNEATDLPVLMQDYWGEVFPMGGISGAPFTGKTGFKAFSSHVAEEGHIMVVFGPHVAISETGEVGMCLRKGQDNESTACGAVIGAYRACLNGDVGDGEEGSYDMQMDWIKRQIAPHVNGIQRSENPMAALAHQSYTMVRDQIFGCVNNDFGSGYLCLVGGIQINLPYPMEDHFLPCTFEMRRAGEPTVDLLREMKEFN